MVLGSMQLDRESRAPRLRVKALAESRLPASV
jgi:hypothetical protein